jgi:DNA-binding PadR family transcriptional regulator
MTESHKLSEKEFVTLELLIMMARPLYGLELVEMSDDRLPRGTIYVILNRLEQKGFISSKKEEPRPGVSGMPRRMYEPTGHGGRVYQLVRQLRELGPAPRPAFAT